MIETTPPNPAMTPPPARLLKAREVMHRLGTSRSTLYRMVRRGEFPAPVEVSPNWLAWREDVVDAWIAERFPPPTLN